MTLDNYIAVYNI